MTWDLELAWGKKVAYNILVGKPEGNDHFG
jgi:hypothetical protein